jgi:hypothetical protein
LAAGWPSASRRRPLAEPAAEGALAPAKLARGFVLCFAFQIAEHQRRPILLRQLLQLVVEQGMQFFPGNVGSGIGRRHVASSLLVPALLGGVGLGPDRQAVGDLVQPVAHGLGLADRVGLAGEDEEGGLESVLGVVQAAEHAPADAQDHGAVPLDQGGEGRLLPPLGEALEQLRVAEVRDTLGASQAAEVAENRAKLCRGNGLVSPESGSSTL